MTNSYIWAWRRCLVMLFACMASTALFAQPQAGVSLDGLLRQSNSVLRQIDLRDTASAWENASAVMRESTKKDEFVARVENDRAGLNSISSRLWQTMNRITYGNGNAQRIPAGDYININYLALDDKGQLLQELISFRFEDEKQWRMTGYIAQKVAAK
jgi:hypothetical protein